MAFIDTALEVVSGARAEILIFIFAVAAHAILFGRHGVSLNFRKTQPGKSGSSKTVSSGARSPKTSSNSAQLARSVQKLLASPVSEQKLVQEMEKYLTGLPASEQVEALSSLLTSVGRSTSKELLSACRTTLANLGTAPSTRLTDSLLRGFLTLRLHSDFKSFLNDIEAKKALSAGGSVLALRAAVQMGDLEETWARLPAVAEAWKATVGMTASGAHGQLFERLVRFTLEKNQLPQLLDKLQAAGIVASWSVEHLIKECVRFGSQSGHLETILALAKTQSVPLTGPSYGALIQGAPTTEESRKLFAEASKNGQATDRDVLLAASAAALRTEDSLEDAREIANSLETTARKCKEAFQNAEVAAALLRLALPGAPLEGRAVELYDSCLRDSDFSSDAQTEGLLITSLLAAKRGTDVAKVVAAAESARQTGLIKVVAGGRNLADCVSVFQACTQKTACHYNALLDAAIFCRDMKEAERIMQEALGAQMADIVTYNTMIKAHLQSGGIRQARRLVERMRQNGLEPNTVTFNELIDASVRSAPHEVWPLIEEMKAAGLQPNHVTCSILLKGISRNSPPADVERALAVVDAKEEEGMDEVLLSSVCEACVRSGRLDLLKQQLQRQRGPGAVQIQGAHTFGSLIRSYGCLGDVPEVWRSWNEMKKRLILPTAVTLGCMVEALAANGEVEAGYEIIKDHMADPSLRSLVNAIIYCSVLKGFSHSKRFDRVWTIYNEMKDWKMQFSIVTYNTLIDACSRSHDMDRIPILLEEMSAAGIDPNLITYSTVIKGYCQENSIDKALKLLEDMKKDKKLSPDEVTYNTILDGCARYGMWERGMVLLKEMESSGVPPSNFTLSVLVKLAHRSRNTNEGFRLCKELASKYNIALNVHVYNNLIHSRTAHGDLSRGLETFQEMLSKRVRPDARSYLLLIRGAVASNRPEDVAGFLNAAFGMPGCHPRLATFNSNQLKLRNGLPSETVTEALEGIASCSGSGCEVLAVEMLRAIRGLPNAPRLDSRLSTALTSKAVRKTSYPRTNRQ
mmetsp:Transcript_57636/g.122582  ORF Transcript_57636/g.122582 Transcript_57636/m.122582 type:complete len:1029 (-) Transcript_57636:200-3286(-)